MNKLVATEPLMWCVLPHDGEYVLSIGPQVLKSFQGKRGERISLQWVLPPPSTTSEEKRR